MSNENDVLRTLFKEFDPLTANKIFNLLVYGDMNLTPPNDGSGEPFPAVVSLHVQLSRAELEFLAQERQAAKTASPRPTYYPDCNACSREKAVGNKFFPNHFASSRCKSGGRNHCTCPICWG